MVFSCAGALGVGDVHLEFDRLLEDSGTGRGLVLCSEAGLGHDAVAQTGNLSETDSGGACQLTSSKTNNSLKTQTCVQIGESIFIANLLVLDQK